MDWATVDIDLSAIDIDDNAYRITTDRNIEPLAASIGATGLLNAPIIAAKANRSHLVVAGFKRVEACRLLGMGRIPARCIAAPAARLAEIAIADNAGQRPLNLVEKSLALQLLHRDIHDGRERDNICRGLGLPAASPAADDVARICRLAAPIQDGILREIIPLNIALALDALEGDAGGMLAGLFVRLHCSQSKQREILTNIQEIAARDDITVPALLKDPQLEALVEDVEGDRNQLLLQVRNLFKARRYPMLTLAEQRFRDALKDLSLGEKISLKAPTGFESGEYLFQLRVNDAADLQACIERLTRTRANPSLKKIFKRQ